MAIHGKLVVHCTYLTVLSDFIQYPILDKHMEHICRTCLNAVAEEQAFLEATEKGGINK